jgi:hypothetical protein
MAEGIALAAGIVGIAGAAATALKVSASLLTVAQSLGAACEEIEDFAMSIRFFSTVLTMGISSVRSCTKKGSSSKVLKYCEEFEVLDQLELRAKRTTRKIERAWKHTESIRSSLSVVTRIRWYFAKPEVQALHPEMETLKTSLLIVMQSVKLEEMRQGEDNEETRLEMCAISETYPSLSGYLANAKQRRTQEPDQSPRRNDIAATGKPRKEKTTVS